MRAESAVEPTRSREHHRDLAALGAFDERRRASGTCCSSCLSRLVELSDGFQELDPSTKRNTNLTEMVLRQVGQDCVVDCVRAKCRLILFEAKAPQRDGGGVIAKR